MKKIISALTALFITGMSVVTASAEALSENNEWLYSLYPDDTAGITSGAPAVLKYGGNVVVPAEIEGHTVIEIGDRSFTGETGLFTVTIPETVVAVGDYAFENCYGLNRVDFCYDFNSASGGTRYIREGAFSNCFGLQEVYLSADIAAIGDYAFANCSALSAMLIPYGTESIGKEAFSGCPALATVVLPVTLKELGDDVFEGCPPHMMIYYEGTVDEWRQIKKDESEFDNIAVTFALSELPDYEPYEESNGFFYKIKSDKTVSLTEYAGTEKNVVIPSEIEGYPVSVIADNCFETRNDIISVEIPDTVREIGEKAFWYCRSLEMITLNEGLEIIGENAFKNCEKLESITLPSTVREIGDNAFEDCTELKEIIIPDSVETIGNRAFGDCVSLEKIALGKGIRKMGEYCFANCEEITNAEIPDGITVVEASLFHNCKKLDYVVIPDSVEVIRGNAFFGCYKLERTLYKGSETEWKDIDIGINNRRLKDSIIIYNYDPATYKPAGPEVAIILCCIAALVPVVVAVIFIIRRKRVCPDCGKKIEDNSKFCGGCGREL